MQEDEFKFKTDIIISDEYCKSLESESKSYNINDVPIFISCLSESDPLKKYKGLFGLRTLLLKEFLNENPKQLYNGDINILFNIFENYPEKFKIHCLKCIILIESINFKIEKQIKNEPSEKTIQIMLYILEFHEKMKLELLILDLEYINLLNKEYYIDKLASEKLYNNIKNLLLNKFSIDEKICQISLMILITLIKAKKEFAKNDKILEIIPCLNDIMDKYQSNSKIKTSVLNLLYELTEINIASDNPIREKLINKIIELKILQKLIDDSDKLDIVEEKMQLQYSIRTIGNIASMPEEEYTDKIIEYNGLDKLKILMQKKYPFEIRKEISWIISNIAAGTNQQLTKLYEKDFQSILFDVITNGEENKVKENCLWALYNFCNINNMEYLDNLVEIGIIDIIIKRLKIDSGDVLCCSLEALNNILSEGKKRDPASFNIIESKINEYDLLNDLKGLLKNCEEEMLKNKIETILDNYYGIQDFDKFLDLKDEENEKI